MIKKMIMFAMAIASRGMSGKKIDLPTKQLRYLSCYGNGEIPQCHKLAKSSHSDFSYCTACGCGDHPHTWLLKNKNEYAKLDYPKLVCPLKMPGFSNYDPNSPIESKLRKELIQNYDPEKLKLIDITISVDPEKEELLNKIHKITKETK